MKLEKRLEQYMVNGTNHGLLKRTNLQLRGNTCKWSSNCLLASIEKMITPQGTKPKLVGNLSKCHNQWGGR